MALAYAGYIYVYVYINNCFIILAENACSHKVIKDQTQKDALTMIAQVVVLSRHASHYDLTTFSKCLMLLIFLIQHD
jgi:hypothetical protein